MKWGVLPTSFGSSTATTTSQSTVHTVSMGSFDISEPACVVYVLQMVAAMRSTASTQRLKSIWTDQLCALQAAHCLSWRSDSLYTWPAFPSRGHSHPSPVW